MSLIEELAGAAMGSLSKQASHRTGMSQDIVEKMLPVAMSAMLGGMRKNASSHDGAEALSRALDRHDGGVLKNPSVLDNPETMLDGQKILRHVFGAKQSKTEAALAQSAGVGQAQMGELMAMAAPALLAMLGQAKREKNLDAGGLSQLIRQETQQVEQKAPEQLGGLMRFLDQDGDGDFTDDLMGAAGKQLFGGLFGRR